ncbi:hypothetical protein [Streptococcus pyogenes]|uniref:hypothetical protein n=1 Tax=Streptococcus pyogenes TaxID=1314 RepID=UPI0010A17CB2|nr:hypothetical protein [Streptococcus pyogenes]VGQ38230.1 hypothetical membrane associated protein [Streptococcus pyogenes]VGQ71878.1 hypothetical membrane associated protein [Streptococcus pyogenes]VGU80470.1 Uncharacterised protein [Streptococcus pyogenes]VHA96814.1 Uncharacterised protein [Streptococcus pyogenes]VHB44348.1 Uncharacterised protein [Streptococcus pyogenes]
MKTKSKRFLNLATLCLALLGTTLLMGRPVKAEVVAEDSDIKKEYMKRLMLTDSDLEHGGYFDKRVQGYLEGYADGQKKNARKPDSNSYGPNFGAYDGYQDGYDEGYSEGWRKANEAGGSHNEESQSSGGKQAKVEESNDDSQTEESNDGSESTQDQDKPVSDLLSVIGKLMTFVLNWFGLA